MIEAVIIKELERPRTVLPSGDFPFATRKNVTSQIYRRAEWKTAPVHTQPTSRVRPFASRASLADRNILERAPCKWRGQVIHQNQLYDEMNNS